MSGESPLGKGVRLSALCGGQFILTSLQGEVTQHQMAVPGLNLGLSSSEPELCRLGHLARFSQTTKC